MKLRGDPSLIIIETKSFCDPVKTPIYPSKLFWLSNDPCSKSKNVRNLPWPGSNFIQLSFLGVAPQPICLRFRDRLPEFTAVKRKNLRHIQLSVPCKSVSVQSVYGVEFVRKLCWKYSDKTKCEAIKSEVNKQELFYRYSTFKASLSR